jgi:hypothetical protein
MTFGTALGYNYLEQITELCKTVFFCTEPYPVSTAILVHGNLFYIFHEFSVVEKENEELSRIHLHHANMCRVNMEVSLSNLNLLLNASSDNIEALLLGVSLPPVGAITQSLIKTVNLEC